MQAISKRKHQALTAVLKQLAEPLEKDVWDVTGGKNESASETELLSQQAVVREGLLAVSGIYGRYEVCWRN